MKLDSLRALYIDELADIYNAETQLLKALPKMAKAATNPRLKKAFDAHLAETATHVERLEDIFARLGEKPGSKVCKAMKGLIAEGSEMAGESGEDAVIDAGLIGAAQRVEHYEIAAYGCARTYAEMLGEREAAQELERSLEEEKAADRKLNDLAKQVINVQAAAV